MDHFSARWRQLIAHWQALSVRTRVVAAALALGLVVGVASLARQHSENEWVTLFADRELSIREVDRMEAAFSTAGLTTWQREGKCIRVPKSEKFTFMAALAENKVLPENSDEVFFETMQSSKFYESSQQRALRIKYATQREAGMIVQSMTGIDHATVRYADVEGEGFGSPTTTKINVAVRTTDQHSLSAEQIAAICDTVAYTIGADVKDVVVTDLVAAKAYRGDDVERLDQQSRLRAQAQREWEASYRQQITDTLTMIDGVVVNVHVQLRSEYTSASSAHPDSTTTALPDTVSVTETQVATPNGDPKPTLLTQGGSISVAKGQAYGNHPRSLTRPLEVTTERATGPATTPKTAPGTSWQIKRVTALVSIPKSHFHKIWHQRRQLAVSPSETNLATAEDTLADIEATTSANVRQLVVSCLPSQAISPSDEQAVVVTSHFDVSADQTAKVTQPSWQTRAMSYWREAIGIFGICVVLFTLTLTMRSAKSARAMKTQPVPAAVQAESIVEDPPASTADSLRGELASRVRQDPAKTADALKHWIRDAA